LTPNGKLNIADDIVNITNSLKSLSKNFLTQENGFVKKGGTCRNGKFAMECLKIPFSIDSLHLRGVGLKSMNGSFVV
jgi:hypothetical protein